MLDALCHLLYPVSAALTSMFRNDSNSTSCQRGIYTTARLSIKWPVGSYTLPKGPRTCLEPLGG
ncbi:hypothetical protein T484DRAFT_3138720 [Baffinella frigidus]|nr:hypothetical protein T484DRAFT_3138720 [Cryptophyta sp. CCMP2293]